MENTIIKKPIDEVIDKLDKAEKSSVFLVGGRGTGKSLIVNNYLEENRGLAIDCTYTEEELLNISDRNIYKLYHICMIINKILNFIEEMYPLCSYYFKEYQLNIKIILFNIKSMFVVNNYDKKEELFGKELYNNPELILNDFCKLLKRRFDYESITLILDNFDALGNSSSRFQKTIYELLNNRIKTIFVLSSNDALNNRKLLEKDNSIVEANYTKDINYVKSILDLMIIKELRSKRFVNLEDRVSFLLDDDIIELLIENTNGDINEMYSIVYKLYQNKNSMPKELYRTFILESCNNRLEILSQFSEIKRERKLYI